MKHNTNYLTNTVSFFLITCSSLVLFTYTLFLSKAALRGQSVDSNYAFIMALQKRTHSYVLPSYMPFSSRNNKDTFKTLKTYTIGCSHVVVCWLKTFSFFKHHTEIIRKIMKIFVPWVHPTDILHNASLHLQ